MCLGYSGMLLQHLYKIYVGKHKQNEVIALGSIACVIVEAVNSIIFPCWVVLV